MLTTVVNKVKELGEDLSYMVVNNKLNVVVEDFVGFKPNGEEIYRAYDEDAVEDFLAWLEGQAQEVVYDYYSVYYLEGLTVCVGYASYDI